MGGHFQAPDVPFRLFDFKLSANLLEERQCVLVMLPGPLQFAPVTVDGAQIGEGVGLAQAVADLLVDGQCFLWCSSALSRSRRRK